MPFCYYFDVRGLQQHKLHTVCLNVTEGAFLIWLLPLTISVMPLVQNTMAIYFHMQSMFYHILKPELNPIKRKHVSMCVQGKARHFSS